MLSEEQIRRLYASARATVAQGMTEVTIDAHVVEAEQQARAYAAVLEEKYIPPRREEVRP